MEEFYKNNPNKILYFDSYLIDVQSDLYGCIFKADYDEFQFIFVEAFAYSCNSLDDLERCIKVKTIKLSDVPLFQLKLCDKIPKNI